MAEQLITPELIKQLEGHMAGLNRDISLVLKRGENPKRRELVDFLMAISETSSMLSFRETDSETLRSPISFFLELEGKNTGVTFSGIPSGHEFTSLILAILQAGGGDLKLDRTTTELITSIEDEMKFEIFVSEHKFYLFLKS